MRRKILVPFIAFLFASCAGNKYKIQAEMDSSIKGTAYLYYEDVLGNEHMISVTDIENGKFSFIGEPGEIPVSANMIVVQIGRAHV